MNTWNDLGAYISSNLQPARQDANGFVLVRKPIGAPRTVTIRRAVDLDGAELVEIVSVLGRDTLFSMRAALRYNRTTRLGAVAMNGDQLALRTALPPAQLSFALLCAIIDHTAAEAARLATSGELDSDSGDIFTHLAE